MREVVVRRGQVGQQQKKKTRLQGVKERKGGQRTGQYNIKAIVQKN